MISSPHQSPLRRFPLCAFTLIELMVAISVLALIIAMVSQLINNTTNVIGLSEKRLGADDQARLAFSRMDQDFRGLINRKDVDSFFCKNASSGTSSGNDAFYFYTDTPGYTSGDADTSGITLAGYRIANHLYTGDDAKAFPDNALERVGRALFYQARVTATSEKLGRDVASYLVYSGTATIPERYGTIPGRHKDYLGGGTSWDGNGISSGTLINAASTVGRGIFRMEICLQVKDPTVFGGSATKPFVVPVAAGSTPWTNANFSGPSSTSTSSNGNRYITMRQIPTEASAVIVTIAVVDTKSLAIATSDMVLNAAKQLPDGDDPSVAKTWIAAINDGKLRGGDKLPPPVAAQVHVYQRSFPLTTSKK